MATRTKSVVRAAKRESNRINQAEKLIQEVNQTEQVRTKDAFQNFAARLGIGTDNQSSYSGYGFNPITRNRMMLDLAYRGSWICRMAVRAIADDMTREGITLGSDLDPEIVDKMYTAFNKKFYIWDKLTEAIGWGRLYGGGGAIILIDGQDMSKPLRIDTIAPDQFCGLLPVDRWMVDPSLFDLVTDIKSQDLGLPKYYNVIHDAPAAPRQKIHHSRFIRFEGDDLPYYQKLSENLWGLSVLEPVFDRIMAFDSATTGTAQLVYRAHLRTYGIKGLRQIIAKGGAVLDAVYEQVDMMRKWQSNEGITLMDAEDKFESTQYAFGGLDSVLIQMGQQISGALQIPLVRLFGQSPAGLNSTGESDLRMYYDGVRTQQERRLRSPLEKLVRIIAKSEAVQLPNNFNFEFVPLWQLTTEQKSSVAAQTANSILQAFDAGAIGRGTVLKELRKLSAETGVWTSITDEEVDEAEKEPIPPKAGEGGDPGGGMGGGMGGNDPPAPPKPMEGAGERPKAANEGDSFLPGSNVIPLRRASLGGRGTGLEDGSLGQKPGGFLPGDPSTTHSINMEELEQAAPFLQHELERIDKLAHEPLEKQLHLHFEDKDTDGNITEFAGFPVVVEYRAGESRNTGSSDGAIMSADYGYLINRDAEDGDSLDVFMGPNQRAEKVYVVATGDPDTREFVQYKCFLGFDDAEQVELTLNAFYGDGRGPDRTLSGNEMTLGEFKSWLLSRQGTEEQS
jgi:phage-related protein (TIGR01555 family)